MTTTPRRIFSTMGFWSLVALAAGLVLGLYGFETGAPWVSQLARAVQPAGILWLNALQLAVLPLVVMQLLVAITGEGNGNAASVARAGKRTAILVAVVLVGGTAVAFLVTHPLVQLLSVSPETVAGVRDSILVPPSIQARANSAPTSLADWVVQLVPTNLFQAGLQGDLIQILLVTVGFGLAVKQLPAETRKPLGQVFKAVSEAILIIVRWILVLTPVGVFAMVVGLALNTGSDALGLLGSYVLLFHGVTLLFVLACYPAASFLGRVGIRRFARAAVRPQLVALGTRSSIAALPAQVESGRRDLGFSATTSGFVVPLLVSVFKLSNITWGATRLLFIATIFGIDLSLGQLVAFTISYLLIGLTVLGVPNGGSAMRTLPAFLAVGIPIEGMVLVHTVRDLNDYASTVSNTTGQFAAATILSTGDREAEEAGSPQGDGPGAVSL